VDFGTASGTVAQGNDSRINNGQTAFSWGNHASAGYVKWDGISNNHLAKWSSSVNATLDIANVIDDGSTVKIEIPLELQGYTYAARIALPSTLQRCMVVQTDAGTLGAGLYYTHGGGIWVKV